MAVVTLPRDARSLVALEAADWLVRTHAAEWFVAARIDREAAVLEQAPAFKTASDVIAVAGPIMAANALVETAWRRLERSCCAPVLDGACAAASGVLRQIGAHGGRVHAWGGVRGGELGSLAEDIVHGAICAAWGAALQVLLLGPAGADGITLIELAAVAARDAAPAEAYVAARATARAALDEGGAFAAGTVPAHVFRPREEGRP